MRIKEVQISLSVGLFAPWVNFIFQVVIEQKCVAVSYIVFWVNVQTI